MRRGEASERASFAANPTPKDGRRLTPAPLFSPSPLPNSRVASCRVARELVSALVSEEELVEKQRTKQVRRVRRGRGIRGG